MLPFDEDVSHPAAGETCSRLSFLRLKDLIINQTCSLSCASDRLVMSVLYGYCSLVAIAWVLKEFFFLSENCITDFANLHPEPFCLFIIKFETNALEISEMCRIGHLELLLELF